MLGIGIDSHIRLGQHSHAVVEVAQLDGHAVPNRTGRGSALGTLAVLAIDEERPISIGFVEVAIEGDALRRGDADWPRRVKRIGISGPIKQPREHIPGGGALLHGQRHLGERDPIALLTRAVVLDRIQAGHARINRQRATSLRVLGTRGTQNGVHRANRLVNELLELNILRMGLGKGLESLIGERRVDADLGVIRRLRDK